MASFEELQAIAAARSKASQEKLAAERASREAAEKAKKLAHDEKLRMNAAKDREMLIAKEQRRKREVEEKKRLEDERRKRLEKREHEMRKKERETLDKAKFQSAAHKAFKKIRSNAKEKEPKGRRMGRNESISPPPNQREHSTLTREEKRQRKEAAMLGLTSTSKRKSSSSAGVNSSKVGQGSNGSAVGALHALGTNKRDIRTVDEIERDLIAARQERLRQQGRGVHRDRVGEEERREQELEGMLRRKKAMEAKRMAQEGALVRDSPMSSDDHMDATPGRRKSVMMRRSPSPINERPMKQKKPVKSAISMPYGLSPADYLPGAPIKAIPQTKSKEKSVEMKPPQNGIKGSKSDKRTAAPEPTVPKKETARDKFLREEAERKRKMAKKSLQFDESDDDDDNDEEDDDDEDDDDSDEESEEEESYDEDLPRAKQSDVSRQIWQMFNRRDKSEYLARDIDSDDEDMEADMESVRREELRSAKLARMEDEREEAEQRRREQEKARRKADRRRA